MSGERILIGIAIGALGAMLLSRRTSHTEVVRNERGQIEQIVEMSDVKPLFGSRIMNVTQSGEREDTRPVEKAEP